MEQDVAVMDVGTGKITVLVASRGVNNTVTVKGRGECKYDGFREDGEWINPAALPSCVLNAINAAEAASHTKINRIYVGVPGAFTKCYCNEQTTSFNKKRRVTESDVEIIHDQGNIYSDDPVYEVINIQPIHYKLDDDRKLIAPVGLMSTRISGRISYILAKRVFIQTFDTIFGAMVGTSIKQPEYLSSVLAESVYLFDAVHRDRYCIFADVGRTMTDLVVCCGDGLISNYYFDFGGDLISRALCEVLNISYEEAEELKRAAILTLERDDFLNYDLIHNNEPVSYNVTTTNEVIKIALDELARFISIALKDMKEKFPPGLPLYITGNGIAHISGAVLYLSEKLGKSVEVVKPWQPLLGDPGLSSVLGIADMVLNNIDKPSIIQRVKNIFTRE